MTEHKTLVIDFEPQVNDTAQGEQNQQSRTEKQLWVRSENSFTFNFFPEGAPAAQGAETALSDVKHQFAGLLTKTSTSSTEQDSGFAFNFQIPVSTPGKMEKEIGTPVPSGAVALKESKEEKPQGQNAQQVIKAPEPTTSSKAKKNKKSGHKKKASEGQQKQMTNLTDTEGSRGEDGTMLTTEQQLKRELDWCIEQLELGMATLKATPKQKEEASRALKTLRSSKAPLAKKRQVMRAMSGDWSGLRMSELSDEASESEQFGVSLSLWLGDINTLVRPEELDVPLDLHTACSIGQYDVVSECIKKGELNLDSKNIGGWTPLMYSSYIGHDNIANLLLEAGVNVNATTGKGLTPLMLAASCGNESIAYFLMQQGAELELKDSRGWTALYHCTSTGHQQMVKFLLDSNANVNVKEPGSGFTPLMEAAASGHEIIVQCLLDHGVKVDERNAKGETARALAMMYGHTKIASLIDMRSPKAKTGHFEDLSSSEDSDSSATPRLSRLSRSRAKGPSIHDGPQAIAKFRVGGPSKHSEPAVAPPGYIAFRDVGEQSEGMCFRDVTSPINELDGQSNSSRDESPFFDNDMPTMRSSSSSSEGLPRVIGLSREGSLESNEDSDQAKKSCSRRANKGHHGKGKGRHGSSSETVQPGGPGNCGMRSPVGGRPNYAGPKDLAEFLEQIGFSKYLPLLEEQDIDLRIFLTLTENDLKEVGITLFGPKRKMTSAIARWHSSARPPSDALEQAYADQLEAEMQEMAIQLHKRCEEVEGLQGQMSQEKELRTVMEGCLMEYKMAWRKVHTELVDNHRLAQDMNAVLEKARACRCELLSRLSADGNGSPYHGDGKLKGDTGGKGGEGLKSTSVSELMTTLDSYEEELGETLQAVLQNLRRLSVLEKVTDSWEQP